MGVFLGIWCAALGGLTLAGGWNGALTQMGWFFTKAALLTYEKGAWAQKRELGITQGLASCGATLPAWITTPPLPRAPQPALFTRGDVGVRSRADARP